MPAPIKPSNICSAVPSATSSLCDRIQAVFLRVPRLLCDFFTWMLNEDGTLTDAFIREVAAFPVGVILFRASSEAPLGWLACSGQEVSRTTYSQLFAVIGTRFGAGNGTTTFNVPNMQRRFPVGFDASDANLQIGATGGEQSHVLLESEMPVHTHRITAFGSNAPSNGHGIIAGANDGGTGPFIYDATTFPANFMGIEAKGGDAAHENRPPFLAGAWIIRY